MTRHALLVPFDDLAPVVDEWRERTCVAKPSHGIPPHVTLLLPCPGEVDAIAAVLAPFPAFDVEFRDVGTFPDALWLAPEPGDVFRALTAALTAAFPDHLPYEGRFPDVVPHLTVAQGEIDDATSAMRERLPIASRAERVALLEQVEPPHWRAAEVFTL